MQCIHTKFTWQVNTFGALSGTVVNCIHVLNMQHFDLIKTLWLETQNNGYVITECCIFPYICHFAILFIFYIYLSVCSHKICGFTWVGVKSEAVRIFSHILVELCATPVPFSSIIPSFHMSIGTNLSHWMSCSKDTLPFDLWQ